MPRIKYPELQDADWLREHYEVKQMTMYDIAALVGCNDGTVYWAMRRHGIQARLNTQRMAKFKPKPCRGCGETFQPRATCHLYCEGCKPADSPSKAHPRRKCSLCAEFFTPARNKKRWTYYSAEFCSAEHRAEFLVNTRGQSAGRRVTDEGYILVRVGAGYPGAFSTGYMLEHRYVMEQVLDRKLLPGEKVHHKNGDKQDNRPENLELWARKQPHGQRVEDLLAWALEFAGQYGSVSFEATVKIRPEGTVKRPGLLLREARL